MLVTQTLPGKIKLLYLIVSLWGIPVYGEAASVDEYLREVEEDAKRLATNPVRAEDGVILDTLDTAGRLPLGLEQEGFERILREQYRGTYLFYQRLNAQNKLDVFNIYKKDNRVSTVRSQTLKLLSGSIPQTSR